MTRPRKTMPKTPAKTPAETPAKTPARRPRKAAPETPLAVGGALDQSAAQQVAQAALQPAPAPETYTHSTSALEGSRLLNRELSWLAFNERVLFEARNAQNPLLERLTFAAICGSNLDEFFMVRVAGIHRQVVAGVNSKSPDGLLPKETLNLVRQRTHAMLRDVEEATYQIFAALREEGVSLRRVSDLNEDERRALRQHFMEQIQPVLTPLIVDPSHPFPYISNLSLNLAVTLDAGKHEDPAFARVKIPLGVLPRVVRLGEHYLLLEDVVASHLDELFRGRHILQAHVFRVTRDTDYEFDEEEADDLLVTIEDGLRRRRFGSAVRLEVLSDMPADLREFLRERLKLDPAGVFELHGPLGTATLVGLDVGRADLRFSPFQPRLPDLSGEHTIFHTLQHGDILLHHPYDSFVNVLNFVQQAAEDPDVLAIKQTLYRTGDDLRLINALRTAAENGKQVVALIELKARFDEQRNITSARRLERVGAHVVYGVSGLKTHGKVTLVVRREGDKLRRYVHVGTGNYNPKTARLYTDLSLLSAREDLGSDVTTLFNHLTGYADAEYQSLLVAPDTARSGFEALLEREIANAAAGKEAWARLKFNSLTDPGMIEALYRASQAGVKVQLVVRGVCCLRPGVLGLSENIEVRSLVGRFLEHARIYAFASAGSAADRSPDIYIGSADWMTRNLDRRVEVIALVTEKRQKKRLMRLLDAEWADRRGSWQLSAEGEYRKLTGEESAQGDFMRG